jgi:hypothetical protein
LAAEDALLAFASAAGSSEAATLLEQRAAAGAETIQV